MQARNLPTQAPPIRLSDEDLVGHYLAALRARGRGDAGNAPLADSPWLRLPPALSAKLAELSIVDLYDLAGAIVYAPLVASARARQASVSSPPVDPPAPNAGVDPAVGLAHPVTEHIDRALLWLRARVHTLRTGQVPASEPRAVSTPPAPNAPPPSPRPSLTAEELSELRRSIGAGLVARFGADAA